MTVTQTDFRAALLDPALAAPAGLTDASGHPAGRRFDVYRNNVAVSLTEALATGFPVVRTLLGEDNFHTVAAIFLRQSPPSSPLMMHYGAGFPAFLRDFPPLAHVEYLHDLAALELALRRAYHGPDSTPIDAAILHDTSPEDMENLVFAIAPTVETLSSLWPIHGIWTATQNPDLPKPRPAPQDVLITRASYDPAPHLLPDGGRVFVHALQSGTPLGTAATLATDAAPEFDLGACLSLLLSGQAITAATLKDTP